MKHSTTEGPLISITGLLNAYY